jgi:hypothetical protein
MASDRRPVEHALGARATRLGGSNERARTLWSAVEAEEAKGVASTWRAQRASFEARIPMGPLPASVFDLDAAVEYALSAVD